MDDPKYNKPSPYRLASGDNLDLVKLLNRVREDGRFDGLFDHRNGNITKVLEEREEAFLEYWNAWAITEPTAQFRDAQETAVKLLVATTPLDNIKFNFFLLHLLTSSHAVRIILPLIPAKFHVNLLRQWWFLTLGIYICQLRPAFHEFKPSAQPQERKGREWSYVVDKALNGMYSTDAHYVKGTFWRSFFLKKNAKTFYYCPFTIFFLSLSCSCGVHVLTIYKAIRVMKVGEETWEDPNRDPSTNSLWLDAALYFADNFDGWGGLGAMDTSTLR